LTPEAIQQYGIKVGSVKRELIASSFVAPARVLFNADAMAHVGSVVSGRVSELKVGLGDVVKKGDVLFVVESPILGETQSDYLLKRAAVETAAPAVELAKNAYDRAKSLFDQSQGIALTEVQRREIEYKAAQGDFRAAEASLRAAENKLHLYGMDHAAIDELAQSGEIQPKYTVYAPISGHVVEREITLGELVQPERDKLLVLADMSSLWVIADIPEARLGDVAKGSKARIKVTAMRDRPIDGEVSFVSPALDPATRTAHVRIEVASEGNLLKPGMFAQVELSSAAAEGAGDALLAIPEEAVQTVEGGPAVFVPVAGEANTFASRAVTIGKSVNGRVPVMSGLKESDEIVVSGTFILKAELGKAGAAHEH
jgi:cobalt-zinc-cadmium efflux system membrane fusion protein